MLHCHRTYSYCSRPTQRDTMSTDKCNRTLHSPLCAHDTESDAVNTCLALTHRVMTRHRQSLQMEVTLAIYRHVHNALTLTLSHSSISHNAQYTYNITGDILASCQRWACVWLCHLDNWHLPLSPCARKWYQRAVICTNHHQTINNTHLQRLSLTSSNAVSTSVCVEASVWRCCVHTNRHIAYSHHH
jgi:hypothetical protein